LHLSWFTVGHVEFPVKNPVQIGLHAIGNIERTIYHDAYVEGTAIRFESFTLWDSAAALLPKDVCQAPG
jgi:hypothetical protein